MNQRTGTPANIPNDVASLQALVARQQYQLAQQEQQLLVQLEHVRALDGEVLHLRYVD
jgi:hypothetical protein